jgi:hypothetical protein
MGVLWMTGPLLFGGTGLLVVARMLGSVLMGPLRATPVASRRRPSLTQAAHRRCR